MYIKKRKVESTVLIQDIPHPLSGLLLSRSRFVTRCDSGFLNARLQGDCCYRRDKDSFRFLPCLLMAWALVRKAEPCRGDFVSPSHTGDSCW